MILAPVVSGAANAVNCPVTIRLIGELDRVLIERFADACAGLAAAGRRTLHVLVCDLTFTRGLNLDRFLAVLSAYEAAGHCVCVSPTPGWRKLTRARGATFVSDADIHAPAARRQIIICHSLDRRAGAA